MDEKADAACTQAIQLTQSFAAEYSSDKVYRDSLARAYCQRGQVRLCAKRCDEAIADLDEAIRLNPEFATAYCVRANAYTLKRDFDKAIADCNLAMRLDPKLSLAYANRGIAHGTNGEYDKAITDFDDAIRIDANEPLLVL